MERMKIAAVFADGDALGGKEITVCGWARTIRDMKTFGFIELNDGSCFKNLQVVMSAEELANYKEIAAQNVGAALIVHRHGGADPRRQAAAGAEGPHHRGGGQVHPRLSPAEEAPQRGIPAHHSASASPHQPILRHLPCPLRGGPWPCTSSSRATASSMSRPPSSPALTARAPARCSR